MSIHQLFIDASEAATNALCPSPMTTKLVATGTALLGSFGLLAQADPSIQSAAAHVPIGWVTLASTIALAVMVFMDKRKIAEASTAQAILDEKDKLIAARDNTITYMESQVKKLRKDLSHAQTEMENYRQMHHDFRNSANARILKLTEDYTAARVLMAEHNLTVPKPDEETQALAPQ